MLFLPNEMNTEISERSRASVESAASAYGSETHAVLPSIVFCENSGSGRSGGCGAVS